MATSHDPELEHFKRTIDLRDYAKKTGYEVRPGDTGHAVTFLEHPNRDRIVVARSAAGAWIYASVNTYEPAAPGESPETAEPRLRDCIAATPDKGTIVEFVQQRDWTARQGEVPLEVVRQRLRGYRESGLALDFEGPLTCPTTVRMLRPGIEPADDARRTVGDRLSPEQVARSVDGPSGKAELNRRRYDWMPSPVAPPETDVEQRLRRWREAQGALERHRGRDAPPPQTVPPSPTAAAGRTVDPALSHGVRPQEPGRGPQETSELHRRRYDWSPAPDVLGAIVRAPRGRGPERGR